MSQHSNRDKRKIIHRIYCLGNRFSNGTAKIYRDDLRHTYDLHRFIVKFKGPLKKSFIKAIIDELGYEHVDGNHYQKEGYPSISVGYNTYRDGSKVEYHFMVH